MKKSYFLLAALVAAFTFTQVDAQDKVIGEPKQDETLRVKVGEKVPQFTVTMVDGKKINIADLKGKVVVVNFWATWCPPCRAELTRVQKDMIDRFAGKDFVFLPISRGETKETVMAFREKMGYTFPMGLDPDAKIFGLFAEKSIPRNFLVDKNGVIVECEVGYSATLFDQFVDRIEKLLNTK